MAVEQQHVAVDPMELVEQPLQLEINASLLMTTTREEFIAQVSRREIPEKADENIARVQRCLEEVLAAVPSVLADVCD